MFWNHLQRHGEVKTEFCPDVTGFCPGLARNLSRCGLILSRLGDLFLGNRFSENRWIYSEIRRRFRCCCVSGGLCFGAHRPVSRASQGGKIGIGVRESSSVCVVDVGQWCVGFQVNELSEVKLK